MQRIGLQHAALVWGLLLAGLAASPAAAQVSVNPGALDLLPARRPAPARPAPPHHTAPASPGATPERAPGTAVAPSQATPSPAAPAATPKPTLPTIPPAIAALPPPAPVPAPRPQPVPVVQVAADAPGEASTVPGGLRVTFGTDRQDLNPATEAALRNLARDLRAKDTVTINILAYAAGTPEDPSTARRLALARALSARAVLINEGIASTRIYPRAMGAVGGDTDRDRVDVLAGPPGPSASVSPGVLPASTAPPAPGK